MGLSPVDEFILFSLGRCQEEVNKRLQGKPLVLSMSKAAFIDLARSAGFVKKGPRALYRNLESLEMRRYVRYVHKSVTLTPHGLRTYASIRRSVEPYLRFSRLLERSDLLQHTKKVRTTLAKG